MGKKLFVGGLAFSVTDQALSDKFAECGTVDSAKVITDRETGRSKGFGFVEMATEEEAKSAVETLNGTELEGRAMTVNEARPQEARGNRGGGGGHRGGGGGGYRSGGGGGHRGGGGGNRW